MRVAVISDIHGNALALDAVLADSAGVQADLLVCLGDVATLGPQPVAVVDRLRRLGCVCVRGNHDDYVLHPELVDSHTTNSVIRDSIAWTRDQLADEHFHFLAGFVEAADLELDDDLVLSVFHGAPGSNTVDLLPTTPRDELDRLLGKGPSLFAGGHTHIQMVRQHRGRLLVNPGSVGMPFLEHDTTAPTLVAGFADYAIIDADSNGVGVTLRRVRVDIDAIRASVLASDNPMGPSLLAAWGEN